MPTSVLIGFAILGPLIVVVVVLFFAAYAEHFKLFHKKKVEDKDVEGQDIPIPSTPYYSTYSSSTQAIQRYPEDADNNPDRSGIQMFLNQIHDIESSENDLGSSYTTRNVMTAGEHMSPISSNLMTHGSKSAQKKKSSNEKPSVTRYDILRKEKKNG